MYHISFINSSVHGHLGHFHVLDIINRAALNIGVHVFFELQFHPYIFPRGDYWVIFQSLSRVHLFATPWTTARQASLFFTTSWSFLKLMTIVLVIPSNHLILCRPLLLLPSIFSSIRVFSSELALHIRWPKYWSFRFSISPSSEYSRLIFFGIDRSYLLAVQGTLKSLL